jgi:mannan polymerase II complex MNN11 subunit
VQWHPTILTKLALIPQRQINSYTVEIDSKGGAKTTYKPNDFLVRPVGCEKDGQRNCERELDVWYKSWRANKKAKKDTPT